jgi:hypothetical protein
MADVHQSHTERAQWYMWGVDIVLFSSSISYVLAPFPGRLQVPRRFETSLMFKQRLSAAYCLLSRECILVLHWLSSPGCCTH